MTTNETIVNAVVPIIEAYAQKGNQTISDLAIVIDHINGETELEECTKLVEQINGI